MKKIIFPLALLGASFAANAQVKVGDNPTTINSNAVFEVESATKGVLLPRVALTSTASPAPLSAFSAGMTVYNTATAGTGVTAVNPGLYYSDGLRWIPVSTSLAQDESLGSIAIFPFAAVPDTYLICNGQAVSRTTYASLFAKIGTTYGVGNGTTTFNLPDLRGEFIRGWDNGRGVDAARVLGSAQADATSLPNAAFTGTTSNYTHNHGIGNGANAANSPGAGAFGLARASANGEATTAAANTGMDAVGSGQQMDLTGFPRVIPNDVHNHTLNINGGGDAETRPRNVAMVYAIKAVESIIVPGGGGGTGGGTTYNGSTSVTLNGTTFERAALTGDVTAAANSNATTIAANAVTSAKIADGAVATADLANNAVTSAKIADATIVTADLADNAVTSAKIVNGTIATADIANNAITVAKLPAGATNSTYLRGDGTWRDLPYGNTVKAQFTIAAGATSANILTSMGLPQDDYKIIITAGGGCGARIYHEFAAVLVTLNGYSNIRFTSGITGSTLPVVTQQDGRTLTLAPVANTVQGCTGEGADQGLTYRIAYVPATNALQITNLSGVTRTYNVTLVSP